MSNLDFAADLIRLLETSQVASRLASAQLADLRSQLADASSQLADASSQLADVRSESAALRTENSRLRQLVAGYERGRFIRLMRWFHTQRRRWQK